MSIAIPRGLTRILAAATAITAGFALGGAGTEPSKAESLIGKAAPDFTLTDLEGKSHTLSNILDGETIVVLEWYNPECPFVKKHYGSQKDAENNAIFTMNTMAKKYAEKKVVWLRINSGAAGMQGTGIEKNTTYAKRYQIKDPILFDESGTVGRAYGAKKTPHMYIIHKDGTVAYTGAIDNDRHPTRFGDKNYVGMALDQLLAGETVTTQYTEAYGCSVKYSN
jgi:peroxiredoxin